MCCLFPCIRWLQRKVDPNGDILLTIVITEVVRWLTIAITTYLSVWRYAEIMGYTVFFEGLPVKTQFWLVSTAIFIAVSLFLYLPLKVITAKHWKDARHTHGWRPSVVTYITMCALPCLLIILIAVERARRVTPSVEVMDSYTTAVIQVIVMGLTVTEWMAKMREEELTFDLATNMAVDFFFAYDVIDFFMLSATETEIFLSHWLYVTFIMGYVAMFKYIPTQPTSISEFGTPKGAVACILISMVCNDVPFVVVRITTMVQYGLRVSDIIHPAKNVAMICLGLTQLYIIYQNFKSASDSAEEAPPGSPGGDRSSRRKTYRERRCARHSTRPRGGATSGGGTSKHRRSDGADASAAVDGEDCACYDMEETTQGRPGGGGSEGQQLRRGEQRPLSSSRVSPELVEKDREGSGRRTAQDKF